MKYLSIIPARGGSKGLPGKNIRDLNGKPLIAWSIEQSLASKRVSMTMVSTDDASIAAVSREYGAQVPFIRPSELAQDHTPTEPVMIHALEWCGAHGLNFDAVILLQPTSPLRNPDSIDSAIDVFESGAYNSLLGVTENHHFYWRNLEAPEALYDFRNRPRRQDIRNEDRLYRENGSIYITKTKSFLQERNRLCEPISMYVMGEEESWEIDSFSDFVVIESLMKQSSS
ncbi:MAG: acylneuraminate cytidylyltransferase family protein [Betaproteobacteria bacterium]